MDHAHNHDHPHHHHTHAPGDSEGKDKTQILLQYTAEHNEHHADELNPLIEAMRAAGRHEAADLAEQARAAFTRGTELLREALDAYTQEC